METIKAPKKPIKKVTKKKIDQTRKDILEAFSESTFGSQCLAVFATIVILKEKTDLQFIRIKEFEKDMRSLNSHVKLLNDKLMQKINENTDLRTALKAKMKK